LAKNYIEQICGWCETSGTCLDGNSSLPWNASQCLSGIGSSNFLNLCPETESSGSNTEGSGDSGSSGDGSTTNVGSSGDFGSTTNVGSSSDSNVGSSGGDTNVGSSGGDTSFESSGDTNVGSSGGDTNVGSSGGNTNEGGSSASNSNGGSSTKSSPGTNGGPQATTPVNVKKSSSGREVAGLFLLSVVLVLSMI